MSGYTSTSYTPSSPSGGKNEDFVEYTGNNTVPTGTPPDGVDTRVLSNGRRYDWDGSSWIFIESTSPWDNMDGTPADQSSSEIRYDNGDVHIGDAINLQFESANQLDGNDGKIGTRTFDKGLNIVGSATESGDNKRYLTIWADTEIKGDIQIDETNNFLSATGESISLGKTKDTHRRHETAYGVGAGEGRTADYGAFIGSNAGRNSGGGNLTAMGYGAGENVVNGGETLALGVYALRGASGDSRYSVALGREAAENARRIYQSSVIGRSAAEGADIRDSVISGAYANRTGTVYRGVSIGLLSHDQGTGNYSNFIGAFSGQNRTGGQFNNGLGYEALKGANNSQYNSAIGAYALRNLAGGSHHNAIGYQAGESATGSHNQYMGYRAGLNNKGSQNLIAGAYHAGTANEGNNNILLGLYAGGENKRHNNLFAGSSSGRRNTQDHCVGIGVNSLYENIGYMGIGIGYQAGRQQSGSYNTFFNREAGYAHQGNHTIGIGQNASRNNNTNQSTFFNVNAGNGATGNNKIGIGQEADYQGTGSQVIGLGYRAGRNNTGSFTTFLGHQAGYRNTGTHVVGIGQNAGLSNTQNNRFIIDNDVMPAFNNHASAQSAIAGSPAGMTYLYYNTATNSISAVRT